MIFLMYEKYENVENFFPIHEYPTTHTNVNYQCIDLVAKEIYVSYIQFSIHYLIINIICSVFVFLLVGEND